MFQNKRTRLKILSEIGGLVLFFCLFSSPAHAFSRTLIYGKVVAQPTQQPISGAYVVITRKDLGSKKLFFFAVTNKAGVYRIYRDTPSGNYTVICSAKGYKTTQQPRYIKQGSIQNINFALTPNDTIPPTVTIKINDGQMYANSFKVNLSLSTQNNPTGSGLAQMRFSNDNVHYSTPEPYSISKDWQLSPGDGEKTVYAQFSDLAGNWSTQAQDSIILDTISPTASQPIDAYTNLFLPADGIDGADNFLDVKGHRITAFGNARINTAGYKFGGGSAFFDGSGDYLTVEDSDDWSFGTGDFTIDFWVRFNDLTNETVLISQWQDVRNEWYIDKDTFAHGNKLNFYFRSGGVIKGQYIMANPWAGVQAGVWYHIAVERTGSTAKLFINGVSQPLTETVAFGSNDVGNVNAPLNIGSIPQAEGELVPIGLMAHLMSFASPKALPAGRRILLPRKAHIRIPLE